MVTPVCLRLGHCRRPPGDAQEGLPVRAHAQCDCAQGTCGRSFGCEWRLSAHGCGPGLSARLVPVHLCRVVTAPPVLWVSRTLGDRAHAGRTGPALCWSEAGGLSRPRVWSQGTSALTVAQVAPRCPSRISPQTRLRRCAQHLPPGLTPRPLVLPWPGGLCGMATGDHGGALGLLSAGGVLTAQGPVSPWPPWPRPPRASSRGKQSLQFRVCVLGRVWCHGPGTRGALTVGGCPQLGHGAIRGSTCSSCPRAQPRAPRDSLAHEGGPGDLTQGGLQGTDTPGEGRRPGMAGPGDLEVAAPWRRDRAGA